MTERGKQLHATADTQIAGLIALISTLDEATLRLPCPGREKLGDGTIAAAARHTADNYQRIATFVQTSDPMSGTHAPTQHGAHRIPRFLRAIGHGPANHDKHAPGAGQYTADTIDLTAVAKQLSATRDTLGKIAELTDTQLDAIPPKDSFRFCDGQRTLEQVLASLLKHQSHQLAALKAVTPVTAGRGSTSPPNRVRHRPERVGPKPPLPGSQRRSVALPGRWDAPPR
jgi:hypothetical protein